MKVGDLISFKRLTLDWKIGLIHALSRLNTKVLIMGYGLFGAMGFFAS